MSSWHSTRYPVESACHPRCNTRISMPSWVPDTAHDHNHHGNPATAHESACYAGESACHPPSCNTRISMTSWVLGIQHTNHHGIRTMQHRRRRKSKSHQLHRAFWPFVSKRYLWNKARWNVKRRDRLRFSSAREQQVKKVYVLRVVVPRYVWCQYMYVAWLW